MAQLVDLNCPLSTASTLWGLGNIQVPNGICEQASWAVLKCGGWEFFHLYFLYHRLHPLSTPTHAECVALMVPNNQKSTYREKGVTILYPKPVFPGPSPSLLYVHFSFNTSRTWLIAVVLVDMTMKSTSCSSHGTMPKCRRAPNKEPWDNRSYIPWDANWFTTLARKPYSSSAVSFHRVARRCPRARAVGSEQHLECPHLLPVCFSWWYLILEFVGSLDL